MIPNTPQGHLVLQLGVDWLLRPFTFASEAARSEFVAAVCRAYRDPVLARSAKRPDGTIPDFVTWYSHTYVVLHVSDAIELILTLPDDEPPPFPLEPIPDREAVQHRFVGVCGETFQVIAMTKHGSTDARCIAALASLTT